LLRFLGKGRVLLDEVRISLAKTDAQRNFQYGRDASGMEKVVRLALANMAATPRTPAT
jgi:hypothetical protein